MNQNTTKETTRKNVPSQYMRHERLELLEKLEQERCAIQASVRKINNALIRFHEPNLCDGDFQIWETAKGSVWKMTRAIDALSEVIDGLLKLPPESGE